MNYIPRFSLVCVALVLTAACGQAPPPTTTPAAPTPDAIARGKYIVDAGGCHDCHTPHKLGPNGPEPDMSRMLSGHPADVRVDTPAKLSPPWMAAVTPTFTAWSGPWGISYTANLTPDRNTGLGIWDEEMFMRAIREGKHMGTSRPILPPMPWSVIAKYSDEDLKAIFAYLRSIPPITNRVPDPK
jgi:hypothetical protein